MACLGAFAAARRLCRYGAAGTPEVLRASDVRPQVRPWLRSKDGR